MDSGNVSPRYNLFIAVELLGVVACFFAGAGSLWSNLDPCWKSSSEDLAIQPYSNCYGIWQGCAINADGSWVCDGYFGKTVIDRQISPRQHYCRAATIAGVILFTFALLLGGIGSSCCKIHAVDLEKKRRFLCVSGWMSLLAGVTVASSGAWYLWEIYNERIWYHQATNPGLGFTMGRGIYLALASGLLGLIAGFCFLFSRSSSQRDSHEGEYKYYPDIPRLPVPSKRTRSNRHDPYETRRHYLPNAPTEYI